VFHITGGGSYCAAGATGADIGLDNSDAGITYTLLVRDSITNVYSTTGSQTGPGPLDFGLQGVVGTYAVIANSTSGCADTTDSVKVWKYCPLPPIVTISGGGGYCAGTTGSINVHMGSSEAFDVSYQLVKIAGGVASNAGSPQTGTGGPLNWYVSDSGTYIVVATNTTSGLSDTMASSVSVVIFGNPTATITTKPICGTSCDNGSVTATASGGTPGYSYLWSTGSTGATTSGLAMGTYTVTVTDANGCIGKASGRVGQIAGTYTQGFYGSTGIGCRGGFSANATTIETGLLSSTALTVGNVGTGYYITVPAGSSGSVINSVMPGGHTPVALTSTTVHSLTGTYLTGGRINNNLLSQTITLILNSRLSNVGCFPVLPGHFFTGTGTCSSCTTPTTVSGASCKGLPSSVTTYLSTHYTADVNGLIALANAELGHVITPGGSVPSYADVCNAVDAINNAFDGYAYSPGTYVSGSCKEGEENPGTMAEASAGDYQVYPNPTAGTINVVIPSSDQEAQIVILDITGRTVATQTVAPNATTPVVFNISNVPAGMYLVKINLGDATHVEKFIKE